MAMQARSKAKPFEGELKPPPPKPAIIGPKPAFWEKGIRIQFGDGRKRIRTQNGLAIFYRALGAMFHAGIRIDRALEILSKQSEEPALAETLPQLVRRLQSGQSLSQSLGAYPWIFPPMHTRLLEVGEATGKLYKILTQIADYEEKRGALLARVKAALVYPAFLFGLSMLLVVVGPPFMFSGLLKFIVDSKGEVPFPTACLLIFSHFVTSPWFFVALAVAAYIIARVHRYLASNLAARRAVMLKLMGVPALGRMLRTIAVTRFARSLAVTLAAGISPLLGLRMAAESADNLILVHRIEDAITGLHNGKTLNESLQATEFFPKAFIQVTKIGEESGMIGESVKKMADLYEVEMDETITQLVSTLEPIWMLMMGVVIGFIAVATMLPIMGMLNKI